MDEYKLFVAEYLKKVGKTSIDELDVSEYSEMSEEWNAKTIARIEEAATQSLSEEVDKLRSDLRLDIDKQMGEINKRLAKFGAVLTKGSAVSDNSDKPFLAQVKEQFLKEEEKLKGLQDSLKSKAAEHSFDFVVKAPTTITNANISGGNVPVEERLTGLNLVPSRRVRLFNVMNQRTTQNPLVSWVYQANKDGTAGQTAEASQKNQIDFDLVVDSEKAKKTTAFIKVSTEMLDDIDWLMGEIQDELIKEILKAVEFQAYAGDGSGENHNGITNQASPFAAGSFAGTIDNANEIDVINIAATNILIAQEGDIDPLYAFVHPNTIARLLTEKVTSTDKRYVDRVIVSGETLQVITTAGIVSLIPTTLVTDGQYLIGDFMKSILVTRQGIRIEVGLDGNDFTNNLRTILAEWRGMTIIKNNDTNAFIFGTFATDEAALETP